jgi:hypothetical protein
MKLKDYLKKFNYKFKRMSNEEVEDYDSNFSYMSEWFYKIAKDEKLTYEQTQEFIDIMYKLLFVKEEIDERYDNVLIGEALEKARKVKSKNNVLQVDEYIQVPVYYSINRGKVIFDEDSMREFFESKLKELKGGQIENDKR